MRYDTRVGTAPPLLAGLLFGAMADKRCSVAEQATGAVVWKHSLLLLLQFSVLGCFIFGPSALHVEN